MTMNRAADIAYFLLRIVAGLLFLQAGGLKMFGWFGGMPPDHSTAKFISEVWIGGVLETVGGILIMIGLFTRPAAFIVSGEMAVAYWQFHAPHGGIFPIQNHGETAALFCFIFLYMAAQGGGIWSVDALMQKRRRTPVGFTPPAA